MEGSENYTHVPDPETLSDRERLDIFFGTLRSGKVTTLVPLLPLVFNLDGKPYSLKHHYQFEPVFRTVRPRKLLLFTGRQVSKSTSEAADALLQSICIPNFKTLFVAPLLSQVRRLSTDRVTKFIKESPIRHLFVEKRTVESVLKKRFTNGSYLEFSYAGRDVERIRGISTDKICFDEVQNMDYSFLPIVMETMSHSRWRIVQYAGTPKTQENTIHGLWLASSQAEWCIPCPACKKDNIASVEYHLLKMIGKVYDPGTDPFLGTVCAHCSRRIDPATGFWLHRYPERRWSFAGYHVPQPIMWIHYSDPVRWAELLAKLEGYGGYTPTRFFNEVLGETSGKGAQLITVDDLKQAACLPLENDPGDPSEAVRRIRQYRLRVLAVDWGGGGKQKAQDSEIPISLTALAVLGLTADGEIHVLWGKRLLTPHEHILEAHECRRYFHLFECHFLAHDYTGAGDLRETILIHEGRIDPERIIPIHYVGAVKNAFVRYNPPNRLRSRGYYSVDKTRSLLLTIAAIKTMKIKFFQYDYKSPEFPGLLHDFLGLVECKVPSARGSDIYTIQRHAQLPDDFAQAVNIGAVAIWHASEAYPDFSTSIPSQWHDEEFSEELDHSASRDDFTDKEPFCYDALGSFEAL